MFNNFTKTEPAQSLTSMMLLLRALSEPACVVHIGAGRGAGELSCWQGWGVPKALIVDADAARLGWAKQLCARQPGWKAAAQLIANEAADVQYYLSSNPDEDSLVPMQLLTALWENIRTVKAKTVSSVSLDQMMQKELTLEFGQHTADIWCLIDCFPADKILLSAERSLLKMSVVIARVVVTDLPSVDSIGLLSTVSTLLYGKGFKYLQVLETTHPSIGYVVFVRDFKATYEQSIILMQTQLQTAQIAIAQQLEKFSDQQLQLDRLRVDRDIQLDTVACLSNEIEAKQLELDTARQQLQKMESVLAEIDQGKLALQDRQTYLRDDLVRAEAQIDLIKELIFTSPPLKV